MAGVHKDLVNRLREQRKASGLTQAELATAVLVSRKTINTIENGVFVPSTTLALKLAAELGCCVEELFQLPGGVFEKH
jgi:putative transcriptional regulator